MRRTENVVYVLVVGISVAGLLGLCASVFWLNWFTAAFLEKTGSSLAPFTMHFWRWLRLIWLIPVAWAAFAFALGKTSLAKMEQCVVFLASSLALSTLIIALSSIAVLLAFTVEILPKILSGNP